MKPEFNLTQAEEGVKEDQSPKKPLTRGLSPSDHTIRSPFAFFPLEVQQGSSGPRNISDPFPQPKKMVGL